MLCEYNFRRKDFLGPREAPAEDEEGGGEERADDSVDLQSTSGGEESHVGNMMWRYFPRAGLK